MTAPLFSSASLRHGSLLAPSGSLSRPRGEIRASLPEEGRAAWRHRRRLLVGAGVGTAVGLGLAAVGGAAVAAAAMAGGDPQRQAQRLVRQGMDKFRRNDVEGSVADFDAALAAFPAIRPFLWQRGLSLYYLGQFQEGAKQFRDDVAVNPNDTEEAIWAFLCEAQMVGAEEARRSFLQVGRDPRPVMRAAYQCFQDGADPAAIVAAAGADTAGHDAFYAWLYVGLWQEAHGDEAAAKGALLRALGTQYFKFSGDYMAALAGVHCTRRGWA